MRAPVYKQSTAHQCNGMQKQQMAAAANGDKSWLLCSQHQHSPLLRVPLAPSVKRQPSRTAQAQHTQHTRHSTARRSTHNVGSGKIPYDRQCSISRGNVSAPSVYAQRCGFEVQRSLTDAHGQMAHPHVTPANTPQTMNAPRSRSHSSQMSAPRHPCARSLTSIACLLHSSPPG